MQKIGQQKVRNYPADSGHQLTLNEIYCEEVSIENGDTINQYIDEIDGKKVLILIPQKVEDKVTAADIISQ